LITEQELKYFLCLVFVFFFSACAKEDKNKTTAITFENLRVEEISSNRAVIRFNTSIPTTCEAEYGLAREMLSNTASDPSMEEGIFELEHMVPLEDLTPDTQYFYRAKATDGSGTTVYSEILTFTSLSNTELDDFTNVATLSQGASISEVSSNFGGVSASNSSSWGANNAIDGSMSSEWATSGDGDNAYLVINLSRVYLLQGVGFRSRKMNDGSAIITSFNLVFDDQSVFGPFATQDPDKVYSFDFPSPVSSQSVRFEAVTSTGGNTGARAIQIFTGN